MYLEVKGPAMERIHKPYELAEKYGFPVMLLLSPQFPSTEIFPESNSLEEPWAEWRPIGTDRVVLRESVGFVRATEPIEGDYVPGSLYESLKASGSNLVDKVQPIGFKHWSRVI